MKPEKLLAEFLGTAFLVAAIVGSGIMAENLTDDKGLQLLQNAFATAGVLSALILAFGPISGAHINPAVTLTERIFGGIGTSAAIFYVVAQVSGGIVGAIVSNIMFDLPAVDISGQYRASANMVFAEGVATLGLLLVIFVLVRTRRDSSVAVAVAVGGYIAGAIYFTSSSSFANPAVTLGRMFTDTFTGISPSSALPYLAAEAAAVLAAAALIRVLTPRRADA